MTAALSRRSAPSRLPPRCARQWLQATRLRLLALLMGLLLGGMLGLPAQAQVAGPDALLTLLDGKARVLTTQGTVAAEVGLKLRGPAIVQLGPNDRLLRLEWPGGTALDLGPNTQLLVAPLGLADKPDASRAALYLLRGWAKLSTVASEAAPQLLNVFSGTLLQQGALVAFVGNGQAWVFDESGAPQVMERPARGSPMTLSAGQFYTRTGSNPGQVLPRAPAEALREVPRAFRDTLPRRHAQVAGKPAAGQSLPQPSFDELQEWLRGESTVRRFIATHFAHWARDANFNAALLAAQKDFPEWAAALHPPKAKRP